MKAEKILSALLCLMALFMVHTAAYADFTVGKDLDPAQITDFYCVIDESTYPPTFLRYHYYTADGKWYLYHETRMGEDWPLNEEDIVHSGTVSLTDEDKAALFVCLNGGTVRATDGDELTDGDDGPWCCLYRTDNPENPQEYRFASPAQRSAFESLCAGLAQNHVMARFFFTRGGYAMPQTYEVFMKQGRYFIQENGGSVHPLDADLVDELLRIIDQCDVESWDGFDESDPYVLDGEDFSLSVTFADGMNVSAYGSNAFPEHYRTFCAMTDAIFSRNRTRYLAGAYRHEESGGSLTLTLHEDGTYVLCDAASDQDLSAGTWEAFMGVIYMTDRQDEDAVYQFGVDDDTLIFLWSDSTPLPDTVVPYGSQFVLIEQIVE